MSEFTGISSQLRQTLADEEQKLLACIHCGLCLEACPTYVITGDENDGPRGRLYLMRAVAEDRLPNTSLAFSAHINRCLGCRACESVCPAGVEYGQLLEASREEIITSHPKNDLTNKLLRFVLRHVWLSKGRLGLAFGAARIFRDMGLASLLAHVGFLPSQTRFAMALLASSRGRQKRNHGEPGVKEDTRPVMLFQGCVGEGLFQRVNRATRRVLSVNGCSVEVPDGQTCCGALHAHAGDLEGARVLARQNIEAFANNESISIVTNAGGCGAMLQTYGHLLANDPEWSNKAAKFAARVKDVGQELKAFSVKFGSDVGRQTVTYDSSCHLLYGQKAADASIDMLKQIAGLPFVTLEGAERCCGGAGIYNLLQTDLSGRVLDEKLQHIAETKAEVLATGNPGCQMQIGAGARLAGMKLTVCHPVELLDESYAKAGYYER